LLFFILTACSNTSVNTTIKATATTNNSISSTATNTSSLKGVILGAQPCPATISDPKHWDSIIPTHAGTDQVGKVACANLESKSTLQALVTTRALGSGAILAAYVFDNITSPNPTKVFALQGLAAGNARISNYNTIITSEVDPNSSINKGQPDAKQQPDLDREFKWSASTQTFVQVAFPGIYPHLTRYLAEDAQAQVNQGQQPWLLDVRQVASSFASSLLKWSGTNVTVGSGGGAQDVAATVTIQKSSGPGGAITLTMSRLEGRANNGVWEVTSASTGGMSITTPAAGEQLSSPFNAAGTGSAFEGVIGQLMVLDHLYNTIGQVQVKGAQGMGQTTFNANASYTSTFSSGHEEGVLALVAISQADGSVSGVVMQKELCVQMVFFCAKNHLYIQLLTDMRRNPLNKRDTLNN
jgi:hypothetical protein